MSKNLVSMKKLYINKTVQRELLNKEKWLQIALIQLWLPFVYYGTANSIIFICMKRS